MRARAVNETEVPAFLRACSEEAFQLTVVEAAKRSGWRVFWIPDWIWRIVFVAWRKGGNRRGRVWAEAGFPDLVMVRAPRLVVAEIKAERGTVRESQRGWLDDLAACGIETHVWRPRDWDDIEAVIRRPPTT